MKVLALPIDTVDKSLVTILTYYSKFVAVNADYVCLNIEYGAVVCFA